MELNDPVLAEFADDDEHVASRQLLNDIDDRIEAEYPGSAMVRMTAIPRTDFPMNQVAE